MLLPGNIELPYDRDPCVYALRFPDLGRIYVGMTMAPLPVRINRHFVKARSGYHPNTGMAKLLRMALDGVLRMEVQILARGIYDEKLLRQQEAARMFEVLDDGSYTLLNRYSPSNIVGGKKICTICGKKKSPEEFLRDARNISGLDGRCKACKRSRSKVLSRKAPPAMVGANRCNIMPGSGTKPVLRVYASARVLLVIN